jgi:hypothetical protein
MAVAAAATSGFLAATGLTWPTILFAAGGTFLGAGATRQEGWITAVLAFFFISLLSAKGGVLLGAHIQAIGPVSGDELAQGCAAALGLFFHPLVTLATRRIEARHSAPAVDQPPTGVSQ